MQGVGDKVHCLMLQFSITMHQVIARPKLPPIFFLRRSENTGIVYVTLIANFSPCLFFFATFGGLGSGATIFYNHLVDLLSQKHNTYLCYQLIMIPV